MLQMGEQMRQIESGDGSAAFVLKSIRGGERQNEFSVRARSIKTRRNEGRRYKSDQRADSRQSC
jgi:hypothetical protein